MQNENIGGNDSAQWLVLMHHMPSRPAYARVKVWRQLQDAGAISLKNGAYVLPDSPQTRRTFGGIVAGIEKESGSAALCEAKLVSGLRDDQVRALFNAAREADYQTVTDELRALDRAWGKKKRPKDDPVQALSRISKRLAAISGIDFFGASGRAAASALLARMEHSHITRTEPPAKAAPADLKNKTWVTRQDIHVDRIACAWLITRFIDPGGSLKFVPGKHYTPQPAEYRYDMPDGEFTHEGDDCSFEVLLRRARISDPALKTIGEIIHDIDLNDGKFGHAETAGISHVISGICRTQSSDKARVDRGRELFDGIYEQYRRRKEG